MTLKTLRHSFLAIMALVLSAGFTLANSPTGNEKAANRLMEQVEDMVEVPEMSTDLNGKAVITFRVTEKNRIEVVKVFSTNPALISHVEEALEGKRVDDYGLEYNQKIRFNLTFNDLR